MRCTKTDRERLPKLLAICLGLSAIFLYTSAEAASPTLFFEDSSVIGVGDTITALRVPVQTASGKFVFKDVTIVLGIDAKGNLRWATPRPIAKNSPPLQTSNVRAGTYVSAADTSYGLQISGPTAIGNGGVAEWAITVAPRKSEYSIPNPAVFYTGPLSGSPLATRLKKVGLTSSEYSYGVIGDATVCCTADWDTNGLIGLRLVGNQLVIASFTESGRDRKDPVDRLVYQFVR